MTDKNYLSLEEIIAGGDQPFVEVEVKSLMKGNKPGVVRLRALSANTVIRFGEAAKDLVKGDVKSHIPQMARLIAEAVVDGEGRQMFTEAEAGKLGELRFDAFTELSNAIVASMKIGGGDKGGDDQGNASGEASPSASPTDSPES